jgi:hypothetical protein
VRADQQTEYIVQCVREGGSMYEADARKFLAEHDAHVRAEALTDAADDLHHQVVAHRGRDLYGGGIRHAETWLRDRAAQLGEEATTTAAPANPDFYQAGHTYTEPDGLTDWKFRVDTITTNPEDGTRTALGWRHFRDQWEPYAYDEDDFEIHQLVGYSDVTEGGEAS